MFVLITSNDSQVWKISRNYCIFQIFLNPTQCSSCLTMDLWAMISSNLNQIYMQESVAMYLRFYSNSLQFMIFKPFYSKSSLVNFASLIWPKCWSVASLYEIKYTLHWFSCLVIFKMYRSIIPDPSYCHIKIVT